MTSGNIENTEQESSSFDYYMLGSGVSGSTGYSPSTIQAEIDAFLKGHKGALTDYENFYIMYLMQEYGAQVTGQDAVLQGKMNSFLTQIQALWNDLYSADSSSMSGASGEALTRDFNNKIGALLNSIKNDTSFFDTPAKQQMQASMESTLESISGIVAGASGSDSSNGLYNLWQEYNSSGGASSTAQGDPSDMSNLMRQLGESNQQFTGESQAVAADTKSDVKLWQTEQDSFNNWGRTLAKCVNYMIQTQRTN